MKKIVALLTALIIAFAIIAQSPGRVRITFTGFNCKEETWDNALQTDGKRDEVYIRFDFSHADKNANPKYNYHFTTPVYGDINGFNGRVKAGTGGNTGGVRTGDVFSTSHVIGEYDIAQDDIITLTPVIWEWDNNDISMQNEMQMAADKNLRALHEKALHSVSSMIPGIAGIGSFIVTSRLFNLPEFANLITNVLGKEGNRPIGVTTDGKFNASILVLNTKLMQQVANSNYGYGTGVVPVEYNERMLGNSRDHGSYTLFIKIEFTPAAMPATESVPTSTPASTAPPPSPEPQNVITTIKPEIKEGRIINPAPPTKNIGNNKVTDKTPRELNRPRSVNISYIGKWVGNWGNNENQPNYYAFVLNSDGTIVLYDEKGNEIGKGTYEFKELILTARYKLITNNILYGINGEYNINDNTLSGSWQKELIKADTGKWSVKKQ